MNLDDIVFERRNKEYGAYAIRKHYSESLNRAVILSVGFVALVFALPSIFKSEKIIPDITTPVGDIILRDPPILEVEPLPEKIKTPVQKGTIKLPPRVTKEPEATTPPESIEEPIVGSETGINGGQPVSIETSNIGGEAVILTSVVEPPKVFDHSEILPSYKGGMEAMSRFLSSKIRYPAIARRNGTEGTVFVQFVIDANGNVTQAKVIKGISKECDAEALRVISMMPSWNPGLQGGTPVMVRRVLPIKFQLN